MAKTRIIAKGAEATIFLNGNSLIKRRDRKSYRISVIDIPLRLRRTRKEVKSLQKAKSFGLNVPSVFSSDENDMMIAMEKIAGKKIRDVLSKKNMRQICNSIGQDVSTLHNNSLIHGDLTTSNMILSSKDNKVYLIDFGLSFVSDRIEDKAVDLHLLRRALESKHPAIWIDCWRIFMKSYIKQALNENEIMSKLEEVELRGRNNH